MRSTPNTRQTKFPPFSLFLFSLFKVLFNFPSRYLFDIGLVTVFSLRWSLPPALGCVRKQPDSRDAGDEPTDAPTGLSPSTGKAPFTGTRASAVGVAAPPSRTPQVRNGPEAEGFGAGLFPLHSPLLGESSLVSFPPLTDMLKFSGYSRLI